MPFPHIVKPVPARRDELLDVAQRLFARNGYDGTSVNLIIAELGVSKGAFYHYFESKEDLVEALACRFAKVMAAETEALLRDPTMDAFSKLMAFLVTSRRHKEANVAELRATFEPLFRAENVQLYEKTQRAVTGVVRPILIRIITEGVAEQTFETSDPENAADTIMHLLTANRDLLTELYHTRDARHFRALGDKLIGKLRYTATVIDRILGLPEGSIELADSETLEAMACTLDPAPSAA
jgi:AcrR family transcriptional regulator